MWPCLASPPASLLPASASIVAAAVLSHRAASFYLRPDRRAYHTQHTRTHSYQQATSFSPSAVCTHAPGSTLSFRLSALSPVADKVPPSHSTAHTLHRPSARVNTAQSALQTTLRDSRLDSRLPRPLTLLHFTTLGDHPLQTAGLNYYSTTSSKPTLRPQA